MPPDSPPVAVPAPDIPESATSTPPGLIALFVAFAKMSLAGFGGVLVWARRGIVDQHRWMTTKQFNEIFALCRFSAGGRTSSICPWCSARALVALPAVSRPGTFWVSLALSDENR